MEAELKSTTEDVTNRAIALCWYLHLMGDVHQPLHCATWFSPEFPGKNGDSGGKRRGHQAALCAGQAARVLG